MSTVKKSIFGKPRRSPAEQAGDELARRAFSLSVAEPPIDRRTLETEQQERIGNDLAARVSLSMAAPSLSAAELSDETIANHRRQERVGNDLAARTSPGTMPKQHSGYSRAGDELAARAFSLSTASDEELPEDEAGDDLASRILM
jgi:hypothetical protein